MPVQIYQLVKKKNRNCFNQYKVKDYIKAVWLNHNSFACEVDMHTFLSPI